MEAPRLERRLVAVLAADVVGYSRHMEQDEAATLATLSSHRLAVDDLITSHNGRITGTAGDSVLAEFSSVVDALDCAIRMQDVIAEANQPLPIEQRLVFRIGINVGDVMVKDGDIFGDGVNIAARLESLAEPGGICVSRGVRDHVRKMSKYAFVDLGEQSVKNIAHPVRAFRVGSSEGSPPSGSVAETTLPDRSDEPAAVEISFWEAIKDSRDTGEFAAYLTQYPNGSFAVLAEARRKALLEGQVAEPGSADPEVSAVELAFWDTVKDSENPSMYSAYLERYPNGAFAALADLRLGELGSTRSVT